MPETYPRVIWTPAQKRKLHPRRGGGRNPKSLKPIKRVDRSAWRAEHMTTRKQLLRYRSDQPTAAFKAIYAEMMAQWEDPARQGEPLNAQHEGLVYGVKMSSGGSEKILPVLFAGWLAVESPAFVLRALRPARELNMWYSGASLKDPDDAWIDKTTFILLKQLRGQLAVCDEATWAAARDAAAALRPEAPLHFRCIISYLFPEQTDWGNADADEALAWKSAAPNRRAYQHASLLLASGADVARLEALTRDGVLSSAYNGEDGFAVSLVDRVGVEAAQALANIHDIEAWYYDPKKRPYAIRLLAMVESAATIQAAAERLDRWKVTSEPDVKFLTGAPELAIPALQAVTRGDDKHPRAAALLAELTAASGTVPAGDFHDRSALPAPLSAPIWGAAPTKKKAPKPLATPALLDCPVETLPLDDEYWSQQEAERAAAATDATDAENMAALKTQIAEGSDWIYLEDHVMALSAPARLEALGMLPEEALADACGWDVYGNYLGPIGAEAVPFFLNWLVDEASTKDLFWVVPRVGAAALAPKVAAQLPKKSNREKALAWLNLWPRQAAVGLIPAAVSTRGKQQQPYLEGLRLLVEAGHAALVAETVAAYGPEVSAFLAAFDLSDGLPDKPPKMPFFWSPANLPPIHVEGSDKPLGPDVVADIGALMVATDPLRPHAGMVALRAAATPASLRAFAEALFRAWEEAGGKVAENWPVLWLGFLGGPEALVPLADKMDAWCRRSFYKRAEQSLDAYVALGTDEAARLLEKVSRRASRDTLKYEASNRLRRIAEARGLEYWDLLESLIPDAGLGPDGAITLDFGPRQFTAGFGPDLKPYVKDGDGEPLKSLPAPRKSDAAAVAGASRALWTSTKKTVREVAGNQVKRMQEAMLKGRRWDPGSWRKLAAHPLLGGLMRSLLWGDYDADDVLVGTFRVDEAGALTDVEDEPYTLTGSPGVPHPIELAPEALSAWALVFADYEIAQPVPQLGREVRRLAPDGAAMLARLKGAVVPTGRLVSLRGRGWERGVAEGAGLVHSTYKFVRGGQGNISLDFDPGMDIGMAAKDMTFQEQTLSSTPDSFGGVHPADLSELLLDLEVLFR